MLEVALGPSEQARQMKDAHVVLTGGLLRLLEKLVGLLQVFVFDRLQPAVDE